MSHLRRRRVSAVLLALLTLPVAGCGTSVSGSAGPQTMPATRRIAAELSTLLPETSRFPAAYPAVILPPPAAAMAAADVNGAGQGAATEPARCAPPALAGEPPAVAVGTSDSTRATLTVVLSRSAQPLSVRRDQLRDCATATVIDRGARATLRTELLPAPPADAEETLAVRQISEPAGGGQGQRLTTLQAQIADVRIMVTYLTFAPGPADTTSLDALFTTAVARVRAAS